MSAMRKIQITPGVYWVEIPEAELFILCACPADSVKHLMKRGLILEMEVKGVRCESGPNAILLSDVLLQNGHFANLAEFPVLQMLYRQGLILPNHPNNTGKRPLLIGSAEQVSSQMKYILRGNYGLLSSEEIQETGVPPNVAEAMMRLKLRFAFGQIRGFDELLDSCIVGNEAVELRHGVWIRRLDMNVFAFDYQGETVTVDLNLPPGEGYESPYPLGFHHIKREYFAVIHSGEGDGWDINRPSMASILMYQGKLYLIDAGPNVLGSLMALGIGVGEIEGIFHTHAHDDHFAGITTLMRGGRRIKYFATPLVRASVTRKLKALLSIREEEFSHFFDVHSLKSEVWNDFEGLEIKPILSPHPIETTIFVFRTLAEDGYRSYAHFADIVSLSVLQGMVTEDSSQPGLSSVDYEWIRKKYLMPATLKKLDIGGGLIHGNAEDFRHDHSNKIILCHTALPLTGKQREIGSSAPFGATDVMIASHTDFARRAAMEYLRSYFPSAPDHQLAGLVNNEVVSFNPGTIILREKERHPELWLVLTGSVEGIRADLNLYTIITAGGMLGEMSALHNTVATMTLRATTFVQALRIPQRVCLGFVKKNNYYDQMVRLYEGRSFLQGTTLFGEVIPYPKQNELAQVMTTRSYQAGEVVDLENHNLGIIRHGALEEFIGHEVFATLGARECFGEEEAVFDIPPIYGLRAVEDTEVCEIPGHLLRDIPIVRWKLFEAIEKRRRRILHANPFGLFSWHWRDEYSIGVRRIDHQHIRLFELGGLVLQAVNQGLDRKAVHHALHKLMDYAVLHFREEEILIRKCGFVGYKEHRKRHRELLLEMEGITSRVLGGHGDQEMQGFSSFFERWLVEHILIEDSQYGKFLNNSGVY
ncbi:MAG: bacteriohemerythrin [Magnetococcales bacterium]|nr:bacteriohemerythrin [Magnetococcales bacterium]MBF0438113.1 bacteriohemerythrin [Magnetococcales bacterium]